MGFSNFTILNVNASRIGKNERVIELLAVMKALNPSVICIQEINVRTVLEEFKNHYQVVVCLFVCFSWC